ncbi:MAG: hypothetical protein ASARMPRED_000386 [Alectoria sarmentosa]|nr:MAG: hypothetical protein ASARMPRED_000386 [Alectoria sarmentosa]
MEERAENRRRGGSKRNSGIFGQEQTGSPSIQRRTSKKASSRDRQGQIYSDEFRETVARATTPDPGQILRSGTPLPMSAFSSSRSASPQFPRSLHTGPHVPTPKIRPQVPSHSRNGSKESTTSRPRTRTLEERCRDTSPTSMISKGRQRVGSLQSSGLHEGEEDSSIGFPSVTSSPPLEEPRIPHRPLKPVSRPLSPIRNPIAAKPGTPLSSSSTDAKKILQLMKTTCGRMHGILSFRTSASSTWASGYCAINVATGSLIYQAKGKVSENKTLIPDLRGCQVRTLYDADSRSTFLDVATRRTSMGIHLRPHVPETFDSWLAALLCWQPIRPKGVQGKMTKPQEAHIAERKLGDNKRRSGNFSTKDASIIKVGKMLMWDKDDRAGISSPPPLHRRASTYKQLKAMSNNWRKVSCTLQENGHFKVILESDSTLMAFIPLSALSRCAIQRLDPSVLDDEFSLAIYPQYASTTTTLPTMQTVYLSMESRVLFEVWFVLLRAFTVPELYGPETVPMDTPSGSLDVARVTPKHTNTDMFRVERLLSIRIIEAKLHPSRHNSSHGPNSQPGQRPSSKTGMVSGNYYAEVQLDTELRGRTAVKPETGNPFWREDFEFVDLPPVLSSASIEIKTRNPGQKDWTLAHAPIDLERGDINPHSIDGEIEVSPLDMTYGRLDLRLDDLERATDTEKWWPIVNEQEQVVGDILMKVRIEELVVLMSQDYGPMLDLLCHFSNGLTIQIAQMAHVELRRISEILLNIFQVPFEASNWLKSLVEDEIDSIHKETPMSKFRFGRRIASQDSYESGVEREVFLRDLGKNATVEANLLFRGNSLLTKALDLHMRRLGKEYLEETLCEKMRDIDESDPECEVDPNRVKNPEDLSRNWRNLIALTENVWKSIAGSANRCPPEIRHIMRHIRACAEDRYGDFSRTVSYSSVSGFLFLRFFCPAVLNPKLFGLLKGRFPDCPLGRADPLCTHIVTDIVLDHARPRAQRTLTLITKALQTLANMTTFGSKEPWMKQMNEFLHAHRPEFKEFVDEICSISPEARTSAIPPSYATPITILKRLPDTSKEGFPSLPYLVDQAREFAALIDVWLDARREIDPHIPMSEELRRFDDLCEESREKSRQCLTRAEQAERPSGILEPKWEELVEQMERKARSREPNEQSSPDTPTVPGSTHTVNSSTSSLADSYFHRNAIPRSSHGASRLAFISTSPHSPRSPEDEPLEEPGSETDTPPGSSSSVWDPGVVTDSNCPPRSSEIDEVDEAEIGISSTDIGSSIYSLTPTSKRTSTSSTPKPIPPITPAYDKRHPGPRSAYSLRRSSDRADISNFVGPRGPGSAQASRKSSHNAAPPGRSIYSLNTSSASQQAIDPAGVPRSPGSRDGNVSRLRLGDIGGVFRKKARDREREEGRND